MLPTRIKMVLDIGFTVARIVEPKKKTNKKTKKTNTHTHPLTHLQMTHFLKVQCDW